MIRLTDFSHGFLYLRPLHTSYFIGSAIIMHLQTLLLHMLTVPALLFPAFCHSCATCQRKRNCRGCTLHYTWPPKYQSLPASPTWLDQPKCDWTMPTSTQLGSRRPSSMESSSVGKMFQKVQYFWRLSQFCTRSRWGLWVLSQVHPTWNSMILHAFFSMEWWTLALESPMLHPSCVGSLGPMFQGQHGTDAYIEHCSERLWQLGRKVFSMCARASAEKP